MLLKDKVSLITGAARGIGKSIALDFANEGSDLILADIDPDELDKTCRFIGKSADVKVVPVVADISKEDDVINLFKTAGQNFKRLDILVNNAGIHIFKSTLKTTLEEWDRVLDINLRGTFLCCKEALKIMTSRNYGKIINISSDVGKKGEAMQAAYCASKAGIIALAETLADEFNDYNININSVLPHSVDTDLLRNSFPELEYSKFIKPADVSKVVLFLASDHSSAIKGAAIEVYNGQNLGKNWF